MKRFFRSIYLKTICFMLILASAAAFVVVYTDMCEIQRNGSYYIGDLSFRESTAFWKAKDELIQPMYSDSFESAFDAVEKSGHGHIIGSGGGMELIYTEDDIMDIKDMPYWFHWTRTVKDAPALTVSTKAYRDSDAPIYAPGPRLLLHGEEAEENEEEAAEEETPEENAVIAVNLIDAAAQTTPGDYPTLDEDNTMRMVNAPGASGSSTYYLEGNRLITEFGNIEFNVTANEGCDLSVSLHSDDSDPLTEYALMLWFDPNGTIYVTNNNSYLPNGRYEPGETYHFNIAVDAVNSVYYVFMTGEDGCTVSLGEELGMYYSSPEGLSRFTVSCDGGALVDNISIASEPLELLRTVNEDESYNSGNDQRVLPDGTLEYESALYPGVTFSFYSSENRQWHTISNDWEGSYDIYVGMTSEYFNELENNWNRSRTSVLQHIYILAALVFFAILLLIYLLAVAGRKPGDNDVHNLLIDKAPVELTGAVGIFGALILAFLSVESVYSSFLSNGGDMFIMLPLACISGMAAAGLITATLQSIVRNVKAGSFLERSLILRLIKRLWAFSKTAYKLLLRWAKKGLGFLRSLLPRIKRGFAFICGGRLTISVMALFLIYTFLIALMGFGGIFVLLFIIPVGGYILFRYLAELDRIKTGIFEIRNGNSDYKVAPCRIELLNNCADALNTINDGVKLSVEREVKAQQMKNELITNVSHDLKTPLTSIISYADLLSSMDLSPKEANDYAKIIKQKGDRLKKLTSDLFDISKAESGNEAVNIERLDIALLLKQSLAELNNEIEGSGLSFITTIPEGEVFASGDGKKLSRVFENLLINAVKYSMPGTRVYVSLKESGEEARVEIKNISAEPMNFTPSEITERFVRGDQSRSTEGSGLGLAIAKSYAELCGGKMLIDVDGDLFKVTVIIKKG